MKINHVISSIDLTSGGPSKSVSDLCRFLSMNKFIVNIITQESQNPYPILMNQKKVKVDFIPVQSLGTRIGSKKTFNHLLTDNNPLLCHGHGLWQSPVHEMAKFCRKNKVPYIISPRGMLEPWALNNGKMKKAIALSLFQKKDLENAACIHATATSEAENIRELGFSNPIAVIPNGIDISEFPLKQGARTNKKKKILFLSRIHPKKGIEMLLDAWVSLLPKSKKDWEIEIAGNGDSGYIEKLQARINQLGIEKEVKLIGPQFGREKLSIYHSADLFVLPTYSENFGIVVAEALACGIPVITTKGAPWEELNTYRAGWWIDIGIRPLVSALNVALSLEDEERLTLGRNGRQLIERKYAVESVGTKMIRLYSWILGMESVPDFVEL